MLGIFLAMDGNQQAEVSSLCHKTAAFAEQIRTGMLQRDEAWHALHSTIMKTLEYPMDANNLTRKQWDYVMAPLLKSTLPCSGVVRTVPRDLLYGPDTFTELGIVHPYYKQNLKHLDLVLRETLTPSITSDLLRSTIEQLKLEIGIPCQDGDWQLTIFSPCLTNCWLRDLLIFCEEEEISLVDTSPFPPLFSSADSYLMQAFADVGYRDDDIATLNQCCLFLHALSLSDLCTADGLSITYDAYNGRRN
jgi:hypothetical protein